MSKWVNSEDWLQNWTRIESIGGGGQASVVKARHSQTGETACVKILSKQKDIERRSRFFREATAYDTCKHPGIPISVESNAIEHGNLVYKLYIALEYIPGPTLEKYVDAQGAMHFDRAVVLGRGLLDILMHIHEEGWLHRDIKHDNIILRDADISRPTLLDFGLSFKEALTKDFHTEVNQEIGNRFLRLPELAVESIDKRYPRSDLAFAAGIIFYALTARLPGVLIDGDGRMPHQRDNVTSILGKNAGRSIMPLLAFFDRGLNPKLENRYEDAARMKRALDEAYEASRRQAEDRDEANLDFVRSVMNRQVQKEQRDLLSRCADVIQLLSKVHQALSQELGRTLAAFQANQHRITEGIETTLGFSHFERNETKFQVVFAVQAVGGQIGVRADAKLIATGDSVADMEPALSKTVRSMFLEGIRSMFDGPGPNLLHRRFFRSPPHGSLDAAKNAASVRNLPVFAVAYDNKHRSLSNIDYALGHFLGHESTKNLVETRFITVLVPANDARSALLVPADDPLETARLVILAPDGITVASETVYANPDEGLKRVQGFLHRINIS